MFETKVCGGKRRENWKMMLESNRFLISCPLIQTLAKSLQITSGYSAKEFLGVFLPWIMVKFFRGVQLDDLSSLHDSHLVRDKLHDT